MLEQLGLIVILGVMSQWLAWLLGWPSILVLIAAGITAGPLLGVLHPDEVLGDLLFPAVSLSVSLILFEGGLSLKFSELKRIGKVVRNLCSLGLVYSWLLTSVAAYLCLDFGVGLSVLTGAMLVITGPTVIIPLLRQVQPARHLGAVLRWEGILTDPLGAILALLVFEAMIAGGLSHFPGIALAGVARLIIVGALVGASATVIMLVLIRRAWVPDFLESPFILMAVVAAYIISNQLQAESGLLTVTLMGVMLANQKYVSVEKIAEFKENLRILLISCLFIVLSARISFGQIQDLSQGRILFLAVIILVVRPVSVMLATFKTSLSIPERVFLGSVAPRGIVAAAVSSVLGFELHRGGYGQAEDFSTVIFLVIVGTVVFYGICARPLARILGVTGDRHQSVAFVGAHWWARRIAVELLRNGVNVIMVDTNAANVQLAAANKIPCLHGSILDDDIADHPDLEGVGKLVALTSNDAINTLATSQFERRLGRPNVHKLAGPKTPNAAAKKTNDKGNSLAPRAIAVSFEELDDWFRQGASIMTLDGASYQQRVQASEEQTTRVTPLFLLGDDTLLWLPPLNSKLKDSSRVVALETPNVRSA